MAGISAKDVKALRDESGAGMMDCKNALKEADGGLERAREILREKGLAKAGKRAGRETTEGAIAISVSGGVGGLIELACETDFVAKTDKFLALAQNLADLVAADASLTSANLALAAALEGSTVGETIAHAVGQMGENIQLKRVARCEAGVAGGYVHAGGKLGVIVSLDTALSGDAVSTLAKDISMHVAAIDPSPIAVDRDGVDPAVVEKERSFLQAQAEGEGKPENVVEKMVIGRINKFFNEICLLDQPFVKDPDVKIKQLVESVGEEAGGEITVASFERFKLGEGS